MQNTVAKGTTAPEFQSFCYQAKRTGLDPMARQIYVVFRGKGERRKMSIQASIDGFRLVAKRSGKYQGQLGPEWCGKDGVWQDVWLSDEHPAAARVGVLHADFKEPLWAVAKWESYAVENDEYKEDELGESKRTGKKVLGAMWIKMPDIMIAKCAEMLALRKAFPQELSGVYGTEEMLQADKGEPVAIPPKATPAPAGRDDLRRPRAAAKGACSKCDGRGWVACADAPDQEERCPVCDGQGIEFAPGVPPVASPHGSGGVSAPAKPAPAPAPAAAVPEKTEEQILAEVNEALGICSTSEDVDKAWESIKIFMAKQKNKTAIGKAFNLKTARKAAIKKGGS